MPIVNGRHSPADERIRVMLLLPSLHGGGAERAAVNLVNRCDPFVFDVRMGLLRKAGPYLDEVDPGRVDASRIGQKFLNFDGANTEAYKPTKLAAAAALAPLNARAMMRDFRPDVVMSFLKGMSVVTYFALSGYGRDRPRWIAREGNNVAAVIGDEIGNAAGRRLITALMGRVYRSAGVVLTNSHEMAATLKADFAVKPERLRTIHNPIEIDRIEALARETPPGLPDRPFIVTAGRLEYQKGHDILLEAFARSQACRDHALVILGKGSREAETRRQAESLGISERVFLPGFTANPWAWFARARLFVLPSRWEGFPSVVAEALAVGTPALVSDCKFGPCEVVEHGRNGFVVETGSMDSLKAGFETLLPDADLRAALSAAGRIRARRFDAGAIAEEYSALFREQAALRRSDASLS